MRSLIDSGNHTNPDRQDQIESQLKDQCLPSTFISNGKRLKAFRCFQKQSSDAFRGCFPIAEPFCPVTGLPSASSHRIISNKPNGFVFWNQSQNRILARLQSLSLFRTAPNCNSIVSSSYLSLYRDSPLL